MQISIIKKRTQMSSKTKNKIKTAKNKPLHRLNVYDGMTVQTRDEFFEGQSNYRKPKYEDSGFYRKAAVLKHNQNNDLTLVKLIGPKHKNGLPIKDLKGRKSKYKPFVETKNHLSQPIKLGKYFIPNDSNYDISNNELKKMLFRCKKNILNKEKFKKFNKKKKKTQE